MILYGRCFPLDTVILILSASIIEDRGMLHIVLLGVLMKATCLVKQPCRILMSLGRGTNVCFKALEDGAVVLDRGKGIFGKQGLPHLFRELVFKSYLLLLLIDLVCV